MGRQIPVAMDSEDERAFLAFLREAADVALYRSWAPAAAPVDSFEPDVAASPFFIHNRVFPWEAQFESVPYTDRQSGGSGSYFRLATGGAPVVEYSRHALGAPEPQVSGRLYWAKLFASPGVAYDMEAFEAWFNSIAKWVRQHGRKLSHGSTEAWFLPGAQRQLGNEP